MTPEDAIEIFCEECKHRHLSERTVEANRCYLDHFADWCAAVGGIADLREATLETLLDYYRWIRHRKKRPDLSRRSNGQTGAEADGQLCSIKYQNRHIRIVKQLFKLLAARRLVMADIGRGFPPLADPRSLPRGIMNKDQVMQLLRQPLMTTPLGFRDRTMLEVLYSTGLRGGELCRLLLYDVDLQERMLRVLGKGSKERIVPVGKVAAGYLGEYIETVRPILTCKTASPLPVRGRTQTGLVFVSVRGLKLWTADLGRIVKMYRAQAHLPDNITTHSLRHTCATELLKGGASIRHVQELLGHADIQTTQIYTHVVPTDLQKAHARTAPSERRQAVDAPTFDAERPVWNDNRNAPYWKAVKKGGIRLETNEQNG